MSGLGRYFQQCVDVVLDPLTLGVGLARNATGPFVLYERGDEWSFGSGAIVELVMYRQKIRIRHGSDWSTVPVGDDPLQRVAELLGDLPIGGWRAYGCAHFELSYLLHDLPDMIGSGPLLHLIVPEREVRFGIGSAELRAVRGTDLIVLLDDVTEPATPLLSARREVDTQRAGGDVFRRAVMAAVGEIRRRRLQKVILSRVVPVPGEIDLVATYEAGRRGNTPARSFLLDLGGVRAAGFSPETVLEVYPNGRVTTQPLAGTRALSGDPAVDKNLRTELLGDPKEIFEHAISVLTAQEELRAVCGAGSVLVNEFMTVQERGSVQHLGSRVSGRLGPGRNSWHAFAELFPAVTASGIPKAAACELIQRYEGQPRGLYSGAVLTIEEGGALDAALVLRTVFQQDGHTWLRAGAGIVEPSDPDREFEETCEKLRSISRFLVPAVPSSIERPVIGTVYPEQLTRTGVRGSELMAQREVNADGLRRTVADIVEEDPRSITDDTNLFELGLDSIVLMQLVNSWRRAGIEVNFAELAENPTIGEWWKLVADRELSSPAAGGERTAAADIEDHDDGDKEDDGAEFPLALMQHAYWIGREDGQRLGGVAAHLYTEFDGADVDPDRLRTAIERVVARHDMLRVRVTDNGRQRIGAVTGWRGLTVHDLRGLDDEQTDDEQTDDEQTDDEQTTARLAAIRDALSHQVLDIERGEVFSTALSLLPHGRTRLHLDVDMVAADAVSYRILLADLARLYQQPDADLPALGYSYRRYRAARPETRREAARQAGEWWQGRLPGLPGAPELPLAATPGPGEHQGSTRVGRRHFVLPAQARADLSEASRRRGLTPAMVVATAFAEILGAWSTQPRFLLNIPLFDRDPVHPDVDKIVGDFTSSVLLEVALTDPLRFVERVRQVQSRMHADAAHADYSGVEVLRDLTRRSGEQVFAPVVFTSALNLGELFDAEVQRSFGDPVWIISQGPQVLLDAQVTEVGGALLVNWDVREQEFAEGVVDAMFGAFESLVRRLAEDSGAWDIPVHDVLPAPQRAIRELVNSTAGPRSGRLLHEGFFAGSRRTPQAPALLWGERGVLSYRELSDRALRVAATLRERGVQPGHPVGVRLPKGPDQVIAVLGVLAAGGVYVPVGVDQPSARADRIARVAGLRVLIAGTAEPPGTDGGPVRLTVREALTAEPLAEPVLGDEQRPAYLLFTSGSTGEPKGVEVPHRAAMNTIDDLTERFELGPADRTLGVSALDFDLSVFDVFGPLSAGGALVLVEEDSRRDAQRWVELIRTHEVTVLNCVPALLDMLLATGADLGAGLRLVLLGGDWVGADLPGRLAAAVPGCRFVGLGGTTETAIHSTVCEVQSVPSSWRSVPYGTPLRNVACRVVDSLGRDCPDWVAGELWIGGTGVAAGYRGDPERSADRFVSYRGQRWYRTGDLARYRADGVLEFLGRRDNQVKIRGLRIELGEVESALLADDRVRTAVAVVAGGGQPALAAGVVVDGAVDPAEIRNGARRLVPAHMVPDRVVILPTAPLTANGKVDRRAVRALLERGTGGEAVVRVPPRTALERAIAMTWAQVLGIDEVGVAEEYFALGGDSVLATSIVARLREGLDTATVSVRTLFAGRTVAGLAERIVATEETPGRSERVAEIFLEVEALSDEDVSAQLGEWVQ